MDRDDAIARVRAARVGRMSTVTPEHRPHVVPFVFALVVDGSALTAFWAVDAKPKRGTSLRRIRNLERNPAIEFVVDTYDDDWDQLWWVRCSGTARVVTDAGERAAALDALARKYPPYAAAPPPGPVVAIDIGAIAGWESGHA